MLTKRESWKSFCQEKGQLNPWQLPYKLATNKIITPPIIGGVRKVDGAITQTESDTIQEIVRVLFPKDEEATDNVEHIRMRNIANNYRNNTKDTNFSKNEIKSVICSLATKRVPGLDGLSMELLDAINRSSPDLLCKLYNKCLELESFPQE